MGIQIEIRIVLSWRVKRILERYYQVESIVLTIRNGSKTLQEVIADLESNKRTNSSFFLSNPIVHLEIINKKRILQKKETSTKFTDLIT